jgi:hypothetical protein
VSYKDLKTSSIGGALKILSDVHLEIMYDIRGNR